MIQRLVLIVARSLVIKMNKVSILLIALMVISVGFLSGCTDSNNSEGLGGRIIPQKPNIRVTSQTTRTGYQGIDFCLYVDIVVKNYGGDGSGYVWAEVKQDTNDYQKRQSVYLNSGESDSLTLQFCEVSFWSSDSGNYRVWVE